MCGVAGYLQGEHGAGISEDLGRRMATALAHRGPDDEGVWLDAGAGLLLAHRRLAIVDLSAAGHQPMHSPNGRFVLAYNGEIYNHRELRRELEAASAAYSWRGTSDTETLLAAVEHWGFEEVLRRANGMFAISLWDRRDRVLWLARDRFGEKPLYYGWCGGSFAFGSELKALRAVPGFANPVSREALGEFLAYLYVPAPMSIHEGIFKLEPGCLLRLEGTPPPGPPPMPMSAPARHGSLELRRWWSLEETALAGLADPFTSEREAELAVESALRRAVELQALADVPLGAFLSGGVDSSLITALMQAGSTAPIRTFTVRFEEAGYDESAHAAAVARHLGTSHTEIAVTAEEARAVVPRLPMMYDEPFADSSQLPTHLVCAAARRHVTVALSGDAGDELFGGYNRYSWGAGIWRRSRRVPRFARQALGAGLAALPVRHWDRFEQVANRLLPGSRGVVRLGEKAHKLGPRLGRASSFEDFYERLVTEWQSPADIVAGLAPAGRRAHAAVPAGVVADGRAWMMYRDTLTYLPDDILCKVDRAAMATSLETRVPFLDKDVAAVAWRVPVAMKMRAGVGKQVLRSILDRYVPRELIDRPKAGFAVPVGEWLRGPLRDWAEALLDRERLAADGYLQPARVHAAWADHLAGRTDRTPALWAVLMFQAWRQSLSP